MAACFCCKKLGIILVFPKKGKTQGCGQPVPEGECGPGGKEESEDEEEDEEEDLGVKIEGEMDALKVIEEEE
jgi:hypothetical protein